MSLFSGTFACFLLLLGFLYFILPKKVQWIILLTGNLVFYAWSGHRYLIYILTCAFFTWFAALKMEKTDDELSAKLTVVSDKEEKRSLKDICRQKKRNWIIAAIIPTLGIWIILKYGPFLFESISTLLRHRESFRSDSALSFIVPLGMSFYTFDAVGYLIDVSRGKYHTEKNFLRYLTFVSFFPHIIQGPFSRFDSLGKTLFAEHRFSWNRLCQGTARILWGYFKKLIIADKLGVCVSEIFTNFGDYYGIHILAVMIIYGIQIYADFSGYMDIVLGISRILGISLEENFRQPYFSRSVEEFWRRWHMTLGGWFRDYLFYPISRSDRVRKIRAKFKPEVGKPIASFIAMFWVWSASGLWHGANWTFLIWGWLNMAIILFSQIADPWYKKLRDFFRISLKNKLWNCFRMIRTFFLLCFLFFITRADSLDTVVQMLRHIFHGFNRKLIFSPLKLFPKLSSSELCIVLVGVIMLIVSDVLCEQGKWEFIKDKTPFPVRNLIYILMIFAIILFAGSGKNIAENFIYANF